MNNRWRGGALYLVRNLHRVERYAADQVYNDDHRCQ